MTKSKITPALLMSLAIISIVGFLGIIGEVWFDFNFISENVTGLILIVIGVGLAVEGQVKRWRTFKKSGFSGTEVTHIVTGVVGMIAVIVGLLTLVGLEGATLNAMQGIIAIIAIVMIVVQTWVVK